MKLPIQIIENVPGQGIPHFIIEPDYLVMELGASSSAFVKISMTLLVNLSMSKSFRDFECTAKNYGSRLPELEIRIPLSFNEKSNAYRMIELRECLDIDFKVSTKDAPSPDEMFIDIDLKALIVKFDVKNVKGFTFRDKEMQTL